VWSGGHADALLIWTSRTGSAAGATRAYILGADAARGSERRRQRRLGSTSPTSRPRPPTSGDGRVSPGAAGSLRGSGPTAVWKLASRLGTSRKLNRGDRWLPRSRTVLRFPPPNGMRQGEMSTLGALGVLFVSKKGQLGGLDATASARSALICSAGTACNGIEPAVGLRLPTAGSS
jgi:hypothetical protein